MQCTGNDLLLGLPSELAGMLLVNWVDLKDVARVDSAYCEASKRPLLLSILCLPFFAVSIRLNKRTALPFTMWTNARSVKVNAMILTGTESVYCEYGSFIELFTCGGMETEHATNICEVMAMCVHVNRVVISGCSMNSASLLRLVHTMSNLPHLQELHVVNCYQLLATDFEEMPLMNIQLPLHKVVLTCNLTPVVYPLLQCCSPKYLKVLKVEARLPREVDQLLLLLPQCHDLTTLGFYGAVDNDTLNMLLPLCPQLQNLDLWNAKGQMDECTAAISTLKKLKTLDVTHCIYSDVLLHGLARNCADLQTLLLEGNLRCISAGVDHVLRQCLQLRTFHVHVFNALPFHPPLMSKLTTLHVTCVDEKDHIHFLKSIAPFCADLQHLHLNAYNFTFLALTTLTSANYPRLRYLGLIFNSDITQLETITYALRRQLPTTMVTVQYVP